MIRNNLNLSSSQKKMSERNYSAEYKNYHGTEEQKKRRALRNAARRMMAREGRVRKGDGKDVDHINGLNNAPGNLRVLPKSVNRGRK